MLTDEEKKLLAPYVTSTDDDVFAVRGMPGMVGAAYARYSRAKGGFREVLLKEFIKEGVIDPRHADQLIERILISYGDDSVGELEGAHVSFENISMLAAKEIEDRRIGGSPIEQSTRYVFYDQKTKDGNWRYLRHPSLLSAPYGQQYTQTMDFIFETYTSLIEPMKTYFESLKPMSEAKYDINGDGEKERYSDIADEKEQKAFRVTYTFDLRSKACDTLRALLPLATETNVGIFGNGRFFQNQISHLLSSDLPEFVTIAEKCLAATSQVIPQYVRRARKDEYQVTIRENMRRLAAELLGTGEPERPLGFPDVALLEAADPDISTLASMLFPYCQMSLYSLRKKVQTFTLEQKRRLIHTYIGDRQTRRDRPGRALEDGYPYTFDMVINFGVYKDLMRHRMNTQQRQLFSAKIGFEMPDELRSAGVDESAAVCVSKANELYESMLKHDPVSAQYAVLHGHYVRWSVGMNDREATHLVELRSTPQGHPQYRKIAQIMHRLIAARSQWRGSAMKFVDYNDYYWSRADSEARQRVKEKKFMEKYKANTF